jgi:hypothetical protein
MTPEAWIRWVRLVAVPFAFFEVAVERGNYPPGYERWGWLTTSVFAAGAIVLFRVDPAYRLAALAFDTAVVTGFVLIYSFELGTPVRQLLILPVLEAALRYGPRGAVVVALATVPALTFFELLHTDRHDLPFDPGHILGPFGIELLVGLTVGLLVTRLNETLTRTA